MAVKISASVKAALMTRRSFMETSAAVAGGTALAVMPIFRVDKVFAASTIPDAPVVTFDSYFTGWPVYAFGGDVQPFEPPTQRQPGAAIAAMSDEEFHRHYMYL